MKRDKLDKKAEPGVFIGYSLQSKAYRIFHPQTEKKLISRDVEFVEQKQWNWDEDKQEMEANELQNLEERIDHLPVRGTRSLSDIYQRCNVAVFEPVEYVEAKRDKKWIAAMQEELTMIEKNDTWVLLKDLKTKRSLELNLLH